MVEVFEALNAPHRGTELRESVTAVGTVRQGVLGRGQRLLRLLLGRGRNSRS